MKYNDNLVDDRVKDYLRGQIKIISSNIDYNFLKYGNEQYMKDLAKISLLIDDKLNEKYFTKNQKELIVESTFSTYECFNKNLDYDIDEFITRLDFKLDNIKTANYQNQNGNKVKRDIFIDKKIKDTETYDSDKKFILTYTHELVHMMGDDEDNLGLIKSKQTKIERFRYMKPSYGRYFHINEMETEYLTQKILEDNFIDLVKPDIIFQADLDKGKSQLSLMSKGYVYNEIVAYSEAINNIDRKLAESYLSDDKSITDRSLEILNTYINLNKDYNSYVSKNGQSTKNLLKMEDSFKSIISVYIKTNNLSDEEYFNFSNTLLENPRSLSNCPVSLNEILVGQLDIEIFYNDSKNVCKKDLINTLEDLSKPSKTIKDFNMNAIAYLDYENNKSDLYKFLEDTSAVRHKDLELNEFIDRYKNRSNDYQL